MWDWAPVFTGATKKRWSDEKKNGETQRAGFAPMFAEQLEKDNWNLLFFDAIRHLCKKLKSKEIELDSILNKKGPVAMRLIRKIIIN